MKCKNVRRRRIKIVQITIWRTNFFLFLLSRFFFIVFSCIYKKREFPFELLLISDTQKKCRKPKWFRIPKKNSFLPSDGDFQFHVVQVNGTKSVPEEPNFRLSLATPPPWRRTPQRLAFPLVGPSPSGLSGREPRPDRRSLRGESHRSWRCSSRFALSSVRLFFVDL